MVFMQSFRCMANRLAELHHVFHALADPTRRSVVERLGVAPTSTTALARTFDMALPSFMQHLAVLERDGLVISHKHGRVRTYRLVPEPLARGERWMAAQRRAWEQRLDQFDAYLAGLEEQR
jgi:DNA-binding transcriptional ArsR family regulator